MKVTVLADRGFADCELFEFLKFLVLERVLDERGKRLWAAAEARSLGRGGATRVAEATGMSRLGTATQRASLMSWPPPCSDFPI